MDFNSKLFADGERFNSVRSSHSAVKQIILSKLLDSVKQCQSEFGAKNELATITSPKVRFLLLQIESVLVHGITRKLSLFNEMAELVSKFLPGDNSVSSCVWQMIKQSVLSAQELEVYSKFNHLTNDAGRVRSWVRMLLNEKSIRRNMDTLISSQNLITFFEDWAFVRDTEMMSAFCQMSTGLQTILFALKTNDADLNSPESLNTEDNFSEILFGELHRNSKIPQPILSINSKSSSSCSNPGSDKKLDDPKTNAQDSSAKSKAKKPLVNLVSFDHLKNSTNPSCQMRVVLPPRSISLSCSLSKSEISSNSPQENLLYIEKAGSIPSDDYASATVDISALTSDSNSQVLSDAEQDVESCDSSNIVRDRDFTETNVEPCHQCKSQCENVHTISARLSRVSVLDRNSQPDEAENNLLSIDETLLVKSYEDKLSQLSQMHGEVLELNDNLLMQNRLKSRLNERLKMELISLRGPLPDDLAYESSNFADEQLTSAEKRPLVNIWIPTSFLTGKGTDVHHVYQVYLRIGPSEWNVYRRYKEFHALHAMLCKRNANIKSKFSLPPKKKFGSKKKLFVDCRRIDLEQYLRSVVNYVVQNFPEFNSLVVSKDTMSHVLPFFKSCD